MRERTILINSMSKTFSVTGWRVGWVIAPPDLTDTIRKVHDFLTVGAATPLQQAGVMALNLPDAYFDGLSDEYAGRRTAALQCSKTLAFLPTPEGAYYIMTDISGLGCARIKISPGTWWRTLASPQSPVQLLLRSSVRFITDPILLLQEV